MKLRTYKGRIWTLSSVTIDETHVRGTDKFDREVILPKDSIDLMIPMEVEQ